MRTILQKNYILLLIILSYFLTRFLNLGIIPIFNDESTYIRFGLHNIMETTGGFYSLMIGKEPLTPYLFAVFGMIFGNELLGARVVSVFFGFLTLIGIYKFCVLIQGRTGAYIASVFYILSPYTLFFDRLALMDSAVSTVSIWTLYFTLRFFKTKKTKYVVFLGMVMGMGMWIKASAFFYVLLPALYLSILFLQKRIEFKNYRKIFISMGIMLLIFLPLYLQPFYRVHEELLRQYTYPLLSIFSFPISVWSGNTLHALTWIIFYLPFSLFILACLGIVVSIKKRENLALFLWLFLPLFYMCFYAKLFTERHVLMLSLPLTIFASIAMSFMYKKNKPVSYFVFGFVVLSCLFYNYFVWFNPQKIPTSHLSSFGSSYSQYVEGNSSGYGVNEVVSYIRELRKKEEIVLVIRNDHGNPEDAIPLYFTYDPQFRNKVYAWGLVTESLKEFKKVYSGPVYFISRGNAYAGIENYIVSEKRFYKPDGKNYIGVSLIDMSKF